MSKSEFILLIPGIIYGVALVDLLKIFRHKKTYWEVVGWGVIMMINLIVSWFNLYDKLEVISGNILLFTAYLLSPLFFAQAVFVLTPEEEHTDTKNYFLETNRTFFSLLLSYIVVNTILSFFISEDFTYLMMRAIIFIPFISIIIWQKKWMRRVALIIYYSFGLYVYISSVI